MRMKIRPKAIDYRRLACDMEYESSFQNDLIIDGIVITDAEWEEFKSVPLDQNKELDSKDETLLIEMNHEHQYVSSAKKRRKISQSRKNRNEFNMFNRSCGTTKNVSSKSNQSYETQIIDSIEAETSDGRDDPIYDSVKKMIESHEAESHEITNRSKERLMSLSGSFGFNCRSSSISSLLSLMNIDSRGSLVLGLQTLPILNKCLPFLNQRIESAYDHSFVDKITRLHLQRQHGSTTDDCSLQFTQNHTCHSESFSISSHHVSNSNKCSENEISNHHFTQIARIQKNKMAFTEKKFVRFMSNFFWFYWSQYQFNQSQNTHGDGQSMEPKSSLAIHEITNDYTSGQENYIDTRDHEKTWDDIESVPTSYDILELNSVNDRIQNDFCDDDWSESDEGSSGSSHNWKEPLSENGLDEESFNNYDVPALWPLSSKNQDNYSPILGSSRDYPIVLQTQSTNEENDSTSSPDNGCHPCIQQDMFDQPFPQSSKNLRIFSSNLRHDDTQYSDDLSTVEMSVNQKRPCDANELSEDEGVYSKSSNMRVDQLKKIRLGAFSEMNIALEAQPSQPVTVKSDFLRSEANREKAVLSTNSRGVRNSTISFKTGRIEEKNFHKQSSVSKELSPRIQNGIASSPGNTILTEESLFRPPQQYSLLCSENFLDKYSEAAVELCSGRWIHSLNKNSRSYQDIHQSPPTINLIDLSLLDDISVEIELPDYSAIKIIDSVSVIPSGSGAAKDLVKRCVHIGSTGRYNSIHILLLCSEAHTYHLHGNVALLQNAVVKQPGCPCEKISFQYVSRKTLAITVIKLSASHGLFNNQEDSLTGLDNDGLLHGRFLLNIAPTLTVRDTLHFVRGYHGSFGIFLHDLLRYTEEKDLRRVLTERGIFVRDISLRQLACAMKVSLVCRFRS